MAISSDDFRDALRHFAAGVTLVTAGSGEQASGLTVSAFFSVSAEPPLIAVSIHRDSAIHRLLAEPGMPFAVSILGEDQADLSNHFAFADAAERFTQGSWQTGATGAPILQDALVCLECRVEESHLAGSHHLYIGAVEHSHIARAGASPLVYWDRAYRRIG